MKEKIKKEIIDFNLTPEAYFVNNSIEIRTNDDLKKLKEELSKEIAFFSISVWNCQAHLQITYQKNGKIESYWLDHEQFGITYEELEEAVYEAGGSITWSGAYPISESIRRKLKEALEKEEYIEIKEA